MKPVIALVLVAAFALAGCGAAPTLAPAARAKAPIEAPSVRVIAGESLISPGTSRVTERQHTAFNLKVLEAVAFTEQEMLEEAETAGYSLQSYAKQVEKFSRVGHVRKTADGKTLLESVDGIFKKTTTVYTLSGTPEILTALATRQNKKSWIRGVVDENKLVTVEKVSAMVDFGFLTNWITKGRVVGSVLDANKRPVAGVTVKVTRLSDKVLFSAQSETDGSFTVKNLVPGDYTAEFSKAGLPTATVKVKVEKRKSTPIEAGVL
jgi:hypothetical protein